MHSALRTPHPALVPKVTDFGLAKATDAAADLTGTGIACGTPNYMAPEQVRSGPAASRPAVDVWGIGAVLFELLTGQPPFVGSDAAGVMDRILKTDPPAVHKLVRGVPRDLSVIVAKCLEKDPARRYLSAQEAADDLDRFLARRPILARPVGTPERAWRWVRRNPVPAAFLAVSTAGCLITGALAVALARSAAVERAARADATAARQAAETARDQLRDALTTAETARKTADAERTAADLARQAADFARQLADLEQALAVEQKAVADGERQRATDERRRAETNLKLARAVIRDTLAAFSRDPRFEGPEFADFRNKLLATARKFRDEVAVHADDSVEWLDDLADVSHWLGYLEYLNNNQPAAAAEYRSAAAAACRWAALDPDDPEARWKLADSLVNCGNALFNHRRYDEAAGCYRDAIAAIETVLEHHRQVEKYLRVGAQAPLQLANVERQLNRIPEAEEAARSALAVARDLTRRHPNRTEGHRLLATILTELARALIRADRLDEAECYLVEAVAYRERLMAATGFAAKDTAEAGAAALVLAGHRLARGFPDRAVPELDRGIRLLEQAVASAPGQTSYVVQLAEANTQAGDTLRQAGELATAEAHFNRAMALLDDPLRQNPRATKLTAAWVRAATGHAHVLNGTERHREAVAAWRRLAARDPNAESRAQAELFVLQSLLVARDWQAAAAGADALAKRDVPDWMWYELALVWCKIGRLAGADEALSEAEKAAAKTIGVLEKGRAAGLFKNPRFVRLVETHPDLAAARTKFDPRK